MSQVRRTKTVPGVLRDLSRSSEHMRRGGERWVYVGTVGAGDVPDDAILSELSPPFAAGITNAQGGKQLVSFIMRANQWVHVRGVPSGTFGGSTETLLFTLPAGFRPALEERFVCAGASSGSFVVVRVQVDGQVILEA